MLLLRRVKRYLYILLSHQIIQQLKGRLSLYQLRNQKDQSIEQLKRRCHILRQMMNLMRYQQEKQIIDNNNRVLDHLDQNNIIKRVKTIIFSQLIKIYFSREIHLVLVHNSSSNSNIIQVREELMRVQMTYLIYKMYREYSQVVQVVM